MKDIVVILDEQEGPALKKVEEDSLRSLGRPVHFIGKEVAVEFLHRCEPPQLGIFPYFRWCSSELLYTLEKCISAGAICLNNPQSVNQLGDKMWVISILAAASISVPKAMPIIQEDDYEMAGRIIGLPIVVKGYPSGGGASVSLHQNHEEALDAVGQLLSKKLKVLVQEYIATSAGRDLRVQICNGRVTHSIQRQATSNEWRSNIALGGSYRPFDLTSRQKELAERVAAELKMSYVGLDFLFGLEDLLFNEANAAFAWHMYPEVAKQIGLYLLA
jgi:RimK family alpha-L-glutamate ligase